MAFRKYWPRLMATSLAWVANDFAFYGNKVFQSTFISILYPGVSGGCSTGVQCPGGEPRHDGGVLGVLAGRVEGGACRFLLRPGVPARPARALSLSDSV